MSANLKMVIDNTRRRESLTPRQQGFIRAMIEDPTSPKAAAVKAGYSERSARYAARRLLQNDIIKSMLAQHFIDKEAEVSELLSAALLQLKDLVSHEDPNIRMKGIDTLLKYARIAKSVLGLEVTRQPDLPELVPEPLSEEEILARLEAEASAVRARINRRVPVPKAGPGA